MSRSLRPLQPLQRPSPPWRVRRLAAYLWASPNSLLGLLAGTLMVATGGRARLVQGVVECEGGLLAHCAQALPAAVSFNALTLGHVILGRCAADLDGARTHEHVHVRQYELLGPVFLPAYLAASGWALLRGHRPYRDNWFERQAYAVAGVGSTAPPHA